MGYRWHPVAGTHTVSGLDSSGLLPVFDNQAEAEEWLTLFYDELSGHGVLEVSLYEDDRLIYGPMPLEP